MHLWNWEGATNLSGERNKGRPMLVNGAFVFATKLLQSSMNVIDIAAMSIPWRHVDRLSLYLFVVAAFRQRWHCKSTCKELQLQCSAHRTEGTHLKSDFVAPHNIVLQLLWFLWNGAPSSDNKLFVCRRFIQHLWSPMSSAIIIRLISLHQSTAPDSIADRTHCYTHRHTEGGTDGGRGGRTGR